MKNDFEIEKPLLTIGIPTYNRPEKIKTQVSLLLPQLEERVHLVVYDNCSTIPVESHFTEQELQKFTVIRNRINVGADANIAKCFENCETQWLWTLSDDDLIKTNAVEIILKEIEKDDKTVFINFCQGISFVTKDFNELVEQFKSPTVFVNSFLISSCVYNMTALSNSLHYYYNNLSSMMGTIIMVLKYLQNQELAFCRFVDDTAIEDFDENVSWDYRIYIRRSRLFFEAFKDCYKNSFNKTLFLGCHEINYALIVLDRKGIMVTNYERWELFFMAIKNQGVFNALKYSFKSVIKVFLNLVMPSNTFGKFEKYFKKSV